MDLFTSQLSKAKLGRINNQDELIKITTDASEFVSRLSKSDAQKK